MTGVKKQYEGRDKDVYEYLKTHDVHNMQEWPSFDLRGYAKYLKEHNIAKGEVPEEVMEMFKIKEK